MIGQRFGNYRAVSLLGEGGMGAVYLALHPDIGRRVAVKVLRPELIKDPQLLLRFLNEARAANAIRHPNIIEILDSGTTADGTPYLVMELLEGEVLAERLRRTGRLSVHDALQFSYQAASALSAAHQKGIIHRDLKPDNLFIVPDPVDPSRERIKVLDFGIAKLQALPTGDGMHTRTGTLMGTPVYMSPEQCLGTKSIDARSDVYALGVILFEMLAGRPPFVSEGFGELVNMHLNVSPRPLRELDPTIPPLVEDLVARALAKSPDGRQASAAELRENIRQAAASEEIEIRGLSSRHVTSTTQGPRPAVGGPGTGTGTGPEGNATPAGGLANTTMSSGTGERHPIVPAGGAAGVRGGLTGRRVLLAGAAALAVVAVVSLAALRRPGRAVGAGGAGIRSDRPSQSGMPPEASARFHLTIDSRPTGADVVDVESGNRMGQTPFVIERPRGAGPVAVRVERSGFLPVTHAFDVDRDRVELVALTPAPMSAPLPAAPGAVPTAASGPAPAPATSTAARAKKRGHAQRPAVRPADEPAKL